MYARIAPSPRPTARSPTVSPTIIELTRTASAPSAIRIAISPVRRAMPYGSVGSLRAARERREPGAPSRSPPHANRRARATDARREIRGLRAAGCRRCVPADRRRPATGERAPTADSRAIDQIRAGDQQPHPDRREQHGQRLGEFTARRRRASPARTDLKTLIQELAPTFP